MSDQILDELYEQSSAGAVYLGYVQVTDHTDMINTVTTTAWQPHPSTLEEAKDWVDSYEKPNDRFWVDVQGVVSVEFRSASFKDEYKRIWADCPPDVVPE